MDLPPGIKSISDIPKDFVGRPLGRRSEIITKISALYPQSDFSDPSWGTLQLPDCWIEFGMGPHKEIEEEVEYVCLHVRGNERAPEVVASIVEALGMPAIDPSSKSGLFEFDPVLQAESFERWQSFRSQVAADLQNKD